MNIYMAGGSFPEMEIWMKEKGYNKLLSQENDRKQIESWSDYKRSNPESKSKLFIDSGAFSAHTKGITIDVDEYIDYLNRLEDSLTIYAQVDKIPGEFGKPKTFEQRQEAPKLSWENYLYMAPKLKNKDKLLPIFHQGEDFKWLMNMLEYTDENNKHIPYIGISPANDVSPKQKKLWLDHVFSYITNSSNPNVQTHAFGMTSLDLLEMYPFTSADSTSWIMTGIYGSIYTPYGSILISDDPRSEEKKQHFRFLPKPAQGSIIKYVTDRGFTMEELCHDTKKRQFLNVIYMNEWAANYKYKGGNLKQNTLF